MKRTGTLLAITLGVVLGVNGCAMLKGKPKPDKPPEEQVLQQIASEKAPKKKSWLATLMFWRKDEPKSPRALPVNMVGHIFVYNAAEKYAVIESGGVSSLAPGTLLAVVKNGAITAQLKVSSQNRPPFLIADLYFGKPEKDDKVFVIDE